MCGICGLAYKDTTKRIDHSLLQRMTDAIEHRGPDSEGFFIHNNIGLGHRRLMIIDLNDGHQPMFNEDNSIVVVYNGEIYNFKEIKNDLINKGHIFKTNCDTEIIVHAYEEYGLDCPNHFRGMFGFAIYDKNKDEIFIVRDRLGIKPIYYYHDNDIFIFGSEIKSITKALSSRLPVNYKAIDFYISLGYVPGDITLFNGINKLPPGHSLTIKNNNLEINEYWDLCAYSPINISFDDAQEQLLNLLKESIDIRLMADVPLGAFLSGGLDSSSVVALMSEIIDQPVKTFSVGYRDDPASSELEYARIVSKHFNTDHHEFILESEDFFESINLLLHFTEEPIVESAAIALYQLSRLAREHVTVILSGEGGDEILAGYPLYQLMRKVDTIHNFYKFVPTPIQKNLSALFANSEKKSKYFDWFSLPLNNRYWTISNDVTSSIKANMYSNDFQHNVGDTVSHYFTNLFNHIEDGTNLRRMSYVDIKSWLPDDLLVKADKMTMATSLELRVPMLDHKLVEFCLSLPDEYRLNSNNGKYLLKKSMEQYLPKEIIYRKKMGFPVPIAHWFRTSLYDKLRDILLDNRCLSRGYFRPEYYNEILSIHRSGKQDLSRRIFSLLVLELWHQMYID